METLQAFALGQANMGKEQRVFDWVKAVELIKKYQIKNATAGLSQDMEWTSGEILRNGLPIKDDYTYLASNWATPIIRDDDTDEEYDCFVMASKTEYDENTKWPDESLKSLNG